MKNNIFSVIFNSNDHADVHPFSFTLSVVTPPDRMCPEYQEALGKQMSEPLWLASLVMKE